MHNYRSRQVHETLNGVNPSSGFRDMRSAKSGPNLWQIWQVFGPWASPYGANGQMSITVHNYRPRQFHRTSNGENPSSGYRDMGSASLAAARPTARPPARTVTTIPLQPGGLRGKKLLLNFGSFILYCHWLRTQKFKTNLETVLEHSVWVRRLWVRVAHGVRHFLPYRRHFRYQNCNHIYNISIYTLWNHLAISGNVDGSHIYI